MSKLVGYNYLGTPLFGEDIYKHLVERFFDENGLPRYEEFLEHADDYGFDILAVMAGGGYTEKVVLPVGKKIIRYGVEKGSYSTDVGVPYERLSMPYIKESLPYHEYVVLEACEVERIVTKGIVAPGFQSAGGVIQYHHPHRIDVAIKNGILKEDFAWINQLKSKT